MPDAAVEQTTQSRAKIFISYSRKDMDFADRLEAALKARGFEPLIDRTDIYAFEKWWERIEALIARADTMVFVLSPDAVASDVALREVSFAASLNKRFAPVVCRRVDDKSVPEALGKLNFIFFDDEASFEHRADQLAEALSTDISWIRQHTDFGEQARRWALANWPSGLLLRSPVLEQAERWIATRPIGGPAATEETQAFIGRSRQAATRRRNILTGSLGVGLVVALCLVGIAYWQRSIAEQQRDRAEESLLVATARESLLLTRDSRPDEGWQTLVKNLSFAKDRPSLRLPPLITEAALTALIEDRSGPELVLAPSEESKAAPPDDPAPPDKTVVAAFDASGERIAAGKRHDVALWSTADGRREAVFKSNQSVEGLYFDDQGKFLIIMGSGDSANDTQRHVVTLVDLSSEARRNFDLRFCLDDIPCIYDGTQNPKLADIRKADLHQVMANGLSGMALLIPLSVDDLVFAGISLNCYYVFLHKAKINGTTSALIVFDDVTQKLVKQAFEQKAFFEAAVSESSPLIVAGGWSINYLDVYRIDSDFGNGKRPTIRLLKELTARNSSGTKDLALSDDGRLLHYSNRREGLAKRHGSAL